MSLKEVLTRFLRQTGIGFGIVRRSQLNEAARRSAHAATTRPVLIKAIMLEDNKGRAIALFPAAQGLDFDALRRQFHRQLRLSPLRPGAGPSCERFDLLADAAIMDYDPAVLDIGDDTDLLLLAPGALKRLLCVAGKGQFSRPVNGGGHPGLPQEDVKVYDILAKIELARDDARASPLLPVSIKDIAVKHMPAMPTMARQLIELKNQANVTAKDVADLVCIDPSLSAQIMHQARSSFYGYRGDVQSVHKAIARVLGTEMAINMALGIAVGKAFRNPVAGPLGLNAFWQHAVYSATLVKAIAATMPRRRRPHLGAAYLAGLLHNIGFLVIGHLFPREMQIFNELILANEDRTVLELESRLLGHTHTEIGGASLGSWNLPPELLAAIRHHHNPDYRGEHEVYVHLVTLADRMLKRRGMGDAPGEDLPRNLLALYGFSEQALASPVEGLMRDYTALDTIARQFAA